METEIESIAQALERLDGAGKIVLTVDPIDAFLLVGSLQLSYRSIEKDTLLGETTKRVAVALQQHIVANEPELTEVLERGWHMEEQNNV